MITAYLGEIRMFAGNFAPQGWALCQGQLLPISANDALYSLIGTIYGGDGQNTFALPNLSSRVPVHIGSQFPIGMVGGTETVTLTTSQLPAHGHPPQASSNPGSQTSAQNGVWAATAAGTYYSNASPSLQMAPQTVGPAGGSQPHDNMLPFLAINFIIALSGVFPSQG